MKRLLFETDWLASQPVFYNEKTGQVGHNINDVIDYANLELHPEGFNNYLDFGYSVLEQTPVKHVKFLRYSSCLWVDEQGTLIVDYLDDPVEQWLNYRISEEDVIDLIRERVQKWERLVNGEIIIPTSGGYDSRLLNWCIENKSRIHSFTYGISENQAASYEVVYAQRLSEILGIRWEQIFLGDFHQYFDEWDRLFGVSTHAHGMYHIEFYRKILPKVKGGNPFLSGIFGDVWAGSTQPPLVATHDELSCLGYTHGLNANVHQSAYFPTYELRRAFIENARDKLTEERYRINFQIRFKMILISYLLRVPADLGFKPWTPFLDIDVCMAMLNLPQERRRNRLWQKDFFQKVGLNLESMNLQATHQNTLDLQALCRIPVRLLDVNLLRDVLKPDYVEWINQNIMHLQSKWKDKIFGKLLQIRKVGGALRRLGFTDVTGKRLEAYNAYIVLLPIENLLRKRDHA
jgi:hypothetical protein